MIGRKADQFIDGQFVWFTGKIEDINDPEGLNRVKVRCFGFYSNDIPKNDLPWATVMMPVTNASIQGNGGNHHLEVGSWVVGFMRDGPSAQDPMVMGSIATQTDGTKDLPTEASVDNKVYKSKAGHLIEIDNTEGSERVNILHKSGSYILMKADGSIEINGNTKVLGTLHATGDISTDAGNAPTLATHTHTEVPGTGGASSPTPTEQETSVAN